MTTIVVYYHFMGPVSRYCANCRRFTDERHANNWMNYMQRNYPSFILDEVYR